MSGQNEFFILVKINMVEFQKSGNLETTKKNVAFIETIFFLSFLFFEVFKV